MICCACGYEFDGESLGKYGCPNCEGENMTKRTPVTFTPGLYVVLEIIAESWGVSVAEAAETAIWLNPQVAQAAIQAGITREPRRKRGPRIGSKRHQNTSAELGAKIGKILRSVAPLRATPIRTERK